MNRMVRQKRIERQWTLEHVGKNIGLSPSTVHDIETGRSDPSYKVLIKLETLFGLSHTELFTPIDEDVAIWKN